MIRLWHVTKKKWVKYYLFEVYLVRADYDRLSKNNPGDALFTRWSSERPMVCPVVMRFREKN